MNVSNYTKDEKLWISLQYKVFEKKIVDCFNLFRAKNIEPILIKGWAVSHFYPNKYERVFTDIDICVKPELYDKALRVFKSKKATELSIDLHRGFRQLDTLKWEELFEWSELIDIDSIKIRVLCPEDHLRILCVHWLLDGGGYREKLWDIYYLVKNRPADFDWDRCLNSVGIVRRKWIVCAIGLAHKYLGLELENTPVSFEAKDLPSWLIKSIEKEWSSEVRLKPLSVVKNDHRRLLQQIKKRFPPNAIQATIELEGDFFKYPRFVYQILNIFQRFYRSLIKN